MLNEEMNNTAIISTQDMAIHWWGSHRCKPVHWLLLCALVKLLQKDH